MRIASLVVAFASSLQAGSVAFNLPSTGARVQSEAAFSQSRATVLLFLGTDCPISNRYSPLLHRMEEEYGKQAVAFYAVFSGPGVAREPVKKHLADFSLAMPGILDAESALAKQTGARVTPEAVVLSRGGAVLYRGRIDNRYVDWGKTRPEATENDLRDALNAVLGGKPVPHATTRALGCAIPGTGSGE